MGLLVETLKRLFLPLVTLLKALVLGRDKKKSRSCLKKETNRKSKWNFHHAYSIVSQEAEDGVDGSALQDDDVDDDHILRMHRPQLSDRFGTLRFRIEMSRPLGLIFVTVIDAWDLPPMDSDGMADPYVEVSLRPGGKKYVTSIKANCLNPTFNETAELPVKPEDIEGVKEDMLLYSDWEKPPISEKDLVLKMMDSDFPLQDELIGVVRLPLASINLDSPSKQYTCLILHEKSKKVGAEKNPSVDGADVAKLNLKVSQQTQENYELQMELKETKGKLDTLREEFSQLMSEKIELEMERASRMVRETDDDINSGELLEVQRSKTLPRSAPVSKGSSPTASRLFQETEEEQVTPKTLTMMKQLSATITEKDKEILKLRAHLKEVKPRLELLSSRNGQIDVGLSFYHITSRLCIDIFCAYNLRAVNLHGKDSDPFAKVKVFRQHEGKMQRWKFETSVAWKTLSPVWNENFTVADVSADDLPKMYVEIIVLDKERFRAAQPLGKVMIGPDQTTDGQHWEEMVRRHGHIVKMTHALRDP